MNVAVGFIDDSCNKGHEEYNLKVKTHILDQERPKFKSIALQGINFYSGQEINLSKLQLSYLQNGNKTAQLEELD